MASSNKTSLGLNKWISTDKPKMADFNSDNAIINTVLESKFGPSAAGAANWDSGNFPVEHGTFTPILGGATSDGNFVLDQQTGYYTRSGKLVYAVAYLRTSSVTALPQGSVQVRGFPIFSGIRAGWYGVHAYYLIGITIPAGSGFNVITSGVVGALGSAITATGTSLRMMLSTVYVLS